MSKSKFTAEDLSRWKVEINPAPIVAKRIKLQRVNNEFLGCCPDVFHKAATGHSDRNPSFTIYKLEDDTWGYKCFSCGACGNVFQFVQAVDKIPFPKAVERVLEEAGVEGWQDGMEQTDAEVSLPDAEPKERVTFSLTKYQPAIEALEHAPEGQAWLRKRGITMETARAFKLGFVQSAEKISPGHAWRDDGWVLIPTLSVGGQIITAVKYRSLVGKKKKAISGILRAPDTSTTLFNAQTVQPGEDLWIVEGEPDAIVLQQAGLVAVAYPMAGYTPTEEECDLLSTAKRIFLAGDSDTEGKKAMDKLAERLSGETHRIQWPNGRKDANDVLTNECGNDGAKFKALVEELKAKALEPRLFAYAQKPRELSDKPIEWVIEGMYPSHGVSLVCAREGIGKGVNALLSALSMLRGGSFLGRKANPVPHVLYVDMENPEAVVRERLAKLGLLDAENLLIWGQWMTVPPSPKLTDPMYMEYAKKIGGFIFFDSLIDFCNGADENDAAAMNEVITPARLLSRHCAGVHFQHHSDKYGKSGWRGTTAITAAVDMAFGIRAEDDEAFRKGTNREVCFSTLKPKMCAPYHINYEVVGWEGQLAYKIIPDRRSGRAVENAVNPKVKKPTKIDEALALGQDFLSNKIHRQQDVTVGDVKTLLAQHSYPRNVVREVVDMLRARFEIQIGEGADRTVRFLRAREIENGTRFGSEFATQTEVEFDVQ